MYLFYSSDIFTLYKKDVLSAISLPEGYCIHFRYHKKFLPNDIQSNLNNLLEKEGVIVYVAGNNIELAKQNRIISFLPIRNVRVTDVYSDKTTELVHIFLKLGVFIKSESIPLQNSQNENQKLPPHKFIFELKEWSSVVVEWHENVKSLVQFDECFKDHLFFNINIKHAEKYYRDQVKISFDDIEKSSYFELAEDNNYLLDLAIFNSSEDVKKFEEHFIKLSYDSDGFFVTNPESISIGADSDNRKYKIITNDISSVTSSAYLKFQSFKKKGAENLLIYEELLRLNIKRNTKKLVNFLLFSILGILGTTGVAFAVSQLSKSEGDKSTYVILLFVGFIFLLTSAWGQFYYFKKRN